MSKMGQDADQFIKINRTSVVPTYRFGYHLMPEMGWMNDPNGFVQFRGQYHMFYQHYPYEPKWGPMHWGHATSSDLVKWSYQPIALAPDEPYDRSGCFSGSAIVAKDTLYLFYTGHIKDGPADDAPYHQVQNMASSVDGVRMEKYALNPVISEAQIPATASQRDFRDPKVTKIGDTYFMVVGSNDGLGHGQALLYTSTDLRDWQYKSVLAKSDGRYGNNWECPDLFRLDSRDALIVSPQNVDPALYLNDHTSLYFLGNFDASTGVLSIGDGHRMDYGFDFYAPQTMEDENGRRIVVGWMSTWGTEWPTQRDHHGWVGALTVPREVVVVGEELHFRPIAELALYRQDPFELGQMTLCGTHSLDVTGNAYELECVVSMNDADAFGICVRVGDHERTVLTYLVATETFQFDRDKSGKGPKGKTSVYHPLTDGHLHVRVFVDTASVEVFLDDGARVLTGLIFPGEDSNRIELFSKGAVTLHQLSKWDLKVH